MEKSQDSLKETFMNNSSSPIERRTQFLNTDGSNFSSEYQKN